MFWIQCSLSLFTLARIDGIATGVNLARFLAFGTVPVELNGSTTSTISLHFFRLNEIPKPNQPFWEEK